MNRPAIARFLGMLALCASGAILLTGNGSLKPEQPERQIALRAAAPRRDACSRLTEVRSSVVQTQREVVMLGAHHPFGWL